MSKLKTFDEMEFAKQRHLLATILEDALGSNWNEVLYYVAGGAVRSVFAGERISDLDIFFFNDKIKPTEFELFEKMTGVFESDLATSYTMNGHKIQFIKKTGGVEEMLHQFDYTIAMGAYVPQERKFILAEDFLYHLAERRLCFNENRNFPISSLWRMKKFLKRGYKIGARDLIVLALSIHNLEIKDYRDLKAQLDGIDTYLLKDITDKMIEAKGDAIYDLKDFIAYLESAISKVWGHDD